MKRLTMLLAVGAVLISTSALARTECRIEMPIPGIFLPVCEEVWQERRHSRYNEHRDYFHNERYDRGRHERGRHSRYDRYERGREKHRYDYDRYDRRYGHDRW